MVENSPILNVCVRQKYVTLWSHNVQFFQGHVDKKILSDKRTKNFVIRGPNLQVQGTGLPKL